MIEAGIERHLRDDNDKIIPLCNEDSEYRRVKARVERQASELEQTLTVEQRELFTKFREEWIHFETLEDRIAFRHTYRIAYMDAVAFLLGFDLARGDHLRRELIRAALEK